jgi:alpha-glucosidase
MQATSMVHSSAVTVSKKSFVTLQRKEYQLYSRWMELSSQFPLYRNHNVKAAISQESYRWSSVAKASRRVMRVRFSMLNYIYTLMYYAHNEGQTVSHLQ